ncbi:MAG TPA: type I-E CRISPR-associated protein Cse1/CasA [Rhodocyclaceae bacterium]|nr:type I-E CRISPR-associated protein Cse1/CasA [Rhodocyclaceae bacterium]
MNLLTDPVFRVRTPDGPGIVSLPGLLALLGEDRIESLPGLQRHQEDAFHIFCCYLAGAVLVRAGESSPKQTAEFWREGIRQLTHAEGCEDDSAWTLVVDDPTKPAFMQPPASSRAVFERDYKPKAPTPDALDIFRTAKNHDVKSARNDVAKPEDWAYALISLQTMTGGLGNGNYGIARMNGFYGSRVCIGWRENSRMGPRFSLDAARLLELRNSLIDEPPFFKPDGTALIWIKQWDGDTPFSLKSIDPFFIEVARRVRLGTDTEKLIAFGASSKSMRIAAKDAHGVLGDPWTPILLGKEIKSLTVVDPGFTTKLLRDLLFNAADFKIAPMQIAPDGIHGGWLTASAFIGGEGTSDGFHFISIRVPERAKTFLFSRGTNSHDRLATLSKRGIELADEIRKPLRVALITLMEGGPDDLNEMNKQVEGWTTDAIRPFTQKWNPLFFDWLWSTVDIPDDTEALRPWFNELRQLAHDTLDSAFGRVPQRHGRSYRAKTKAQGIFLGSLKKNFSQFMEVTHDNP